MLNSTGLITHLLKSGFILQTFDERPKPRGLIIRHDVDISPRYALEVARDEAEQNIKSIFFFMLNSPYYRLFDYENLTRLQHIAKLGHEIGLHYWGPVSTWTVALQARTLSTCSGTIVRHISFHAPSSSANKIKLKEPLYNVNSLLIDYYSDTNNRSLPEEFATPCQLNLHPVWQFKSSLNEVITDLLSKKLLPELKHDIERSV